MISWFGVRPVYDEGEYGDEWGVQDSVGAYSREEAADLWWELEGIHHRGVGWIDVVEADAA